MSWTTEHDARAQDAETDHAPEPQAIRSAKIYIVNNGWGERHGPLTMRDLMTAFAAEVARREQAERERNEAMSVLAPNMPESGLVDACKQVKQAAISEADNATVAEARLTALQAALEGLPGVTREWINAQWADRLTALRTQVPT